MTVLLSNNIKKKPIHSSASGSRHPTSSFDYKKPFPASFKVVSTLKMTCTTAIREFCISYQNGSILILLNFIHFFFLSPNCQLCKLKHLGMKLGFPYTIKAKKGFVEEIPHAGTPQVT